MQFKYSYTIVEPINLTHLTLPMRKSIFTLFILVLAVFIVGTKPSPAQAATPHPPGTLINSGGTIWQINEAGTARLGFDSAEKFLSNRLSFDRAVPANSADLALPQTGFQTWGDGVLFADRGVIYQVVDGKKFGFTSAEVFLGQGYTFPMVKSGNLSGLSEGTSIKSAGAKHLDGTLLLSSDGTIWTWDNGVAKAFPSEAVFYSQGGNYAEVVHANNNDAYSRLELMTYRTGSLINDNGAVWAITAKNKLGFPSAQCFLGFGFNFSFVFNGSTSSLSKGGTICADVIASTDPVKSYSSQSVTTTNGTFTVKAETFNLASGKVRVITDTAADKDCATNCPVASLSAYLTANNAQHGMNGTYFCPADYADCASKSGSFFWKVIDTKIGKMINAGSGLGENDPFLTFDSLGQPKYFSKWNDYKASSFTASAGINSPSLIETGQITLNTSKLDDKQKTTKAARGAIGLKGNTLYLVHVLGATVPDTASVLKAMGLDYALLMDGGGSSAMMYDGEYKTGPGRNIPNAVLVEIIP